MEQKDLLIVGSDCKVMIFSKGLPTWQCFHSWIITEITER